MKRLALGLIVLAVAGGCAAQRPAGPSFGDDLAFLKQHTNVIVLSDAAGQVQVAVSPALQGRVMTSTTGGLAGPSFGWINRDLMASGRKLEHFNPVGGEERFWLGPEGGQFSIYFAKGVPFDLEHWYVPAAIDTEPFDVVSTTRDAARFARRIRLTNYSGTVFDVAVDRHIRLLEPEAAWKALGIDPPAGVKVAAFESVNRITNAGTEPWKKETGLLSIWILSMFNPSPATTVVAPIQAGTEAERGRPVVDDYFGKVPAERLIVKDKVVFFSADGTCRSKIGFGPKRTTGLLGSYDAAGKVLTLAKFTFDPKQTDYVNSQWKLQDAPFAGDVANSYNDGPPAPGAKPMGPFYELESSSPAAALEPGKSLEHVHRTIHLSGPEKVLDAVARATLGVSLREIATAIPR